MMKFNALFTVFLFVILFANAQVIIDVNKTKQVIDGFGASTAWHGVLTTAEADAAFKNENVNQMGLSILRVRISPNSSDWSGWANEKANAQKAKATGALILASPWSPPAALKTNNNTTGGELKPESYAAYASHLKSFCTYLGNVDVVSIQNEPNIQVDYESCDWSPEQLLDFCKNYASGIGTPVMMPEAYNFDWKFSDPVLNDSAANANIDYIGGHIYGATAKKYTNAIDKGKKVWMTEHYYNGDTIEECLRMAREIAECMNSDMNAYVWWWLRQPGCNLMNTGGTLKKKGYTMGQFSKFVRPGYIRLDASFQPSGGVYVVAFKGAGQNVIVVVNQNKTMQSQTFIFRNDTVNHVRKYVTSSAKNINDEGIIECSRNGFRDVFEPQSITTYVTVNSVTGINSLGTSETRVYPNPFTDEVTLELKDFKSNADIQVLTPAGQLVLHKKTSNEERITMGSSLNGGMYIVKITDGEKQLTYKIIKQ
jgi:glucuronoarabinoxylan endo-1,4-beta-xylanase